MQYLAQQLKQDGKKVLFTTTTKIFRPVDGAFFQSVDRILNKNLPEQLFHIPEKGTITVAGYGSDGSKKLSGIDTRIPALLIARNIYDTVLVEADGSRQYPIKAPSENEPVLPDDCQLVVGVTGWQGINQPVSSDSVHRWQDFSALTGLYSGEKISPAAMVKLLNSKSGLFKNTSSACKKIWLINQLDSRTEQQCATEFVHSVIAHTPAIHNTLLSHLNQSNPWLKSIPRPLTQSFTDHK